MQLLKITNIPIKIDYNSTPARLEMHRTPNPVQHMDHNPAQLNLKARNIQVRLDTTEMRASLNLRNPGDFARYYGSKGMQQAYETIGEQVQFGNQMAQIQDGVTIAQIVKQRMLEQPTTYTTFLPPVGTDISWQPEQLQINYDPGSLKFDWELMKNTMNYIPGNFQLNITQYPKVQIEYLGEPTYVPPSSKPGY